MSWCLYDQEVVEAFVLLASLELRPKCAFHRIQLQTRKVLQKMKYTLNLGLTFFLKAYLLERNQTPTLNRKYSRKKTLNRK